MKNQEINFSIQINPSAIVPIYRQIEESIVNAIDAREIAIGDKIPSINWLCREFNLAPGTVTRAYEELRQRGIIASKQGKGYYVASTYTNNKLKIFLLFDRLNPYKEILYESFSESIGSNAEVDVYFHHYDIERFKRLIQSNLGWYSYYIIMPHLYEDTSEIINQIPAEKLILIDRDVKNIRGNYAAVYQDFYSDIYNGLKDGYDLLQKYRKINLVLSKSKFQFVPPELVEGFKQFCKAYNFDYCVERDITEQPIQKQEVYIVFADRDLIHLLRYAQENQLMLGSDIGLISFDETPVKEFISDGITVLTTDFVEMGRIAALMILENKRVKVSNKFGLIRRKSV